MKELYTKIDEYFKYDKSDSIFLSIFKSIILLFSGGLFGFILKEYLSNNEIKYTQILLFLFLVSIFIFLEIRRLRKEKNFPISIINHLNATEDLIELRQKYSRKTKVFEFIDNSIQSLNSNTCPISYGEQVNDLCQQDLRNGLQSVVDDLVFRTNYFYNIDKSKFTVGIFLNEIAIKDEKLNAIYRKSSNYIFRDDLNINELIPEDLMNFDSDAKFKILTAFHESISFEKFLMNKFNYNGMNYNLICSPIPNVCESCPSIGVIYTIYEGEEKCSEDSKNVLLIHGRIVSNWISKYEDCLYKSSSIKEIPLHKHEEIVIPKEIESFGEK